MKTSLLFLLASMIIFTGNAQNTDMPGPDANLQTVPNGSYVIPMDNTLQTDNIIGSGNFNLKSYGLIVYLLNNNVKLKWVIKAGKAKDGIDFTGTAEQIKPAFIAAASRNFIAGPFVIFAQDTSGISALVEGFYTVSGLTGNNRPKVFRLTSSVSNVDIRYDMSGFKPKVAILTDGGHADIHVGYMTACSIPTGNYTTGLGNDLLTKCFTFASEPHNDNSGTVVNNTVAAIRKFVEYGGNFLAQCAAVETYENNINGKFQSTGGLTVTNTNLGATLSFPNSDLSFSQFQGNFDGGSGSLRNWTISGAANNEHNHVTGINANASRIAASVSKLRSGSGGLIYYVGSHEFKVANGITGINGIRMYMNAVLTPNTINRYCNTGETLVNPLPVKLVNFTARYDRTNVILNWETAQELNFSHYVIESSTDGNVYSETAIVFGAALEGAGAKYNYTDRSVAGRGGIIYYRLRMVDIDGKTNYSAVRIVVLSTQKNEASITTFPNPVTSEVRIMVPADWQGKVVSYEITGAAGQIVKSKQSNSSSQTETINVSNLARGMYFITVTCNGETARQKIVKQ